MKFCIITCYNQPDYIRARTLRAAARQIDGIEVLVVKNTNRGIVRYAEVLWRLLVVRLREHPDAYLLTFRGYEMLLPVRLLSIGKPLMYDEFINPIEWVSYEHKKISPTHPITRLLRMYYRVLLNSVRVIFTDTESHADLSSGMMKIPRKKFVTLPVGTDEKTFVVGAKPAVRNKLFTVFYYGNMLPLHGLSHVIDAAVKLREDPVRFVLIGGNDKVVQDVASATAQGAQIEYKKWVDFDTLPGLMNAADLCLAGPFGDTFQAQHVVTGKAYQYLAMGRPTVVGANKESHIFTHQKDALVVRQGNSNELVDAIRWASTHTAELNRIGDEGRKLYESKLSVNQVAQGLELVLLTLARK